MIAIKIIIHTCTLLNEMKCNYKYYDDWNVQYDLERI